MNTEKSINEAEGNAVLPLVRQRYLSIHSQFVSKDEMRGWMQEPFNVADKTISTNGLCLIATPKVGEYQDRTEKVKTVYPMPKLIDKQITVSELKEKLNTVPLVDCYDEIEKECDACNGSGHVDFTFDYGLKEYELEGDCPVCDGEGIIASKPYKPNGKKEYDYNKYGRIGNSIFNLHMIEELILIAETIDEKTIHILNQKEFNSSLFQIGEIEIIMMPMAGIDETDVAFNVA